MARRYRRRRSLGIIEPVSGSLLLWGGAALVAWLLLKKKDAAPAAPSAPMDRTAAPEVTERRKQIADRSGGVPIAPKAAPKSAEDTFKDALSRGLDAAKLRRVQATASEDFFGPLWNANLLDEYIAQACSGTTPNARTACEAATAYGKFADEAEQRRERGDLGAPLVGPKIQLRVRLFPALLDLGLPKEYEEPYYAFLAAYFEQATFPQTQVVYTALCADDAGSAACKLAGKYRQKQAPRL